MKLNTNTVNFFDSNPLPSWICEPSTFKVIDVNRAAVKAFGISKSSWLKYSLHDRIRGLKKSKSGITGELLNKKGIAQPIVFYTAHITMGKKKYLLCSAHSPIDISAEEPLADPLLLKNFKEAITHASIVSIADKDGTITYVNDNFIKISGYSESELLGEDHQIINSGHHPTSFWDEMWATIMAGNTWRADVKNVAKDGSYYWVDTFIMPFSDSSGNITQFLSIRNDITNRKIAEEQIQSVAQRLTEIMRFAKMGITELDLKTQQIGISPELYEVFEENDPTSKTIPLDDFLNKYVLPVDHDIIQQKIGEGKGSDSVTRITGQFRARTAQGNVKTIEAIGTFNSNGKVLGILQDVTTRNKAFEEAHLRGEQINQILESITDGFFAVDRQYNFILLNSVFEKMSGFAPGTLIGKNLWETFPFLVNSVPYEKYKEVMETGVAGHFEYRSLQRPGIFFEVHAYPNADGLLIYFRNITERKQQEEELKKLAFIASHTSDAVILADKEHKILWVNNGFERITEYKLEEVVGKATGSFLYGAETDTKIVEQIAASLELKKQFRLELWNYSKQGRKYWVDVEVLPMKNEQAEVTGFMVIQSDITTLKTAVHEMLKSQELMQTIMDKAPLTVYLKDIEGRYVFYNKSFAKYGSVNHTKKFITDFDLFSPAEAESFRASDEYVIQTGKTLEVEQEIELNGITESYYTIKFPVRDNNQALYAVGGVSLLITDRKQAASERKKLKEEQARLDKIVRESYNEIYLFNWDNLQFEFSNASALKNIGYTQEEFLTMKFSNLFNFPDEMALKALLAPLKRGETDRVELQIKHIRKNGTYYDVNTLIQVLEKDRSFVAIAADITQKLITEKKLLASIVEKETLIKEIHHRVKNNLQLISSIIYIKMASQTEPELKYFLENTRQKIRSIALIHERLLQSEKLDKVDIADYLGKLVYDLQITNYRQDLELDIKMESEEYILNLDTAIYCGLMVNELITNAIKHAFKGRKTGNITVSFRREVNNYLLSVKDDGITMPLDVTPGKSGSFGMHLLEIFVRQLGGSIEIIREKGTNFQIRFSP